MIIDNLREADKLTYTEEILRDYIVEYPKSIIELTAKELADVCHVSISSVTRLAKKLGFKKFTDFKVEFAQNYQKMIETDELAKIKPFDDQSTIEDVITRIPYLYQKSMSFTQATLDLEIVRWSVEKTNKSMVFVFATGINISIAEIFSYKLEELGIICKVYDSLHYQLIDLLGHMNSSVFAIFLSHSGQNPAVLDAAKRIHKNGISSVLITGANHSGAIEHYSDKTITIIPTKNTHEFSTTLWGISIQYVLDIFVSCLYVKRIKLVDKVAMENNYYK